MLDAKYKRKMRWDECYERLPPGPCTMVEVGVWGGGTSYRLLNAKPNLHMVLVDPYETAVPGSSYANSGSVNALKPQRVYNRVLLGCQKRLKPFDSRITWMIMGSVEAARLCSHLEFDLVFIDGDHSYEGVRADIDAWAPLIKQSGWIGGHDYGRKRHHFPGVEKAVDETFGGVGVELGADATWWVQCR